MVDSESVPFTLDPVPPDVRAENKRARREVVRRSMSKGRRRQAAKGMARLDVFVAADLAEALDRYKDENGLKNRSEALGQFLRQHIEQLQGSEAVAT